MRYFFVLFFVFCCSGCSNLLLKEVEESDKQQTVFPINAWYSENDYDDHYLDKVEPILSKRCVTCHGCYEAPCQLNLQSYAGVRRGYNATPIYNAKRLKSMPITQMNDVYPLSKWRELDFLPVVANNGEPKSANWSSSLFMTLIVGGYQYNQPGFPLTSQLEKVQNNFKRFKIILRRVMRLYVLQPRNNLKLISKDGIKILGEWLLLRTIFLKLLSMECHRVRVCLLPYLL
jgi:hypothetical protein